MSALPPSCLPALEVADGWTEDTWDCVVVVLPSFKHAKNGGKMAAILNSLPPEMRKIVREAKELDAAAASRVSLVKVS